MQRLQRLFRYLYLRILRQKGSPGQIAGGVALGTFFGFLLPPGTQMAAMLVLSPLLRCNLVGALAAVWVSNPFTMPFIYSSALPIGNFLTGITIRGSAPLEEETFWQIVFDFQRNSRFVIVMMTGLTAMGALAAPVAYYLTRTAVITYRARKPLARAAQLRVLAARRRWKRLRHKHQLTREQRNRHD